MLSGGFEFFFIKNRRESRVGIRVVFGRLFILGGVFVRFGCFDGKFPILNVEVDRRLLLFGEGFQLLGGDDTRYQIINDPSVEQQIHNDVDRKAVEVEHTQRVNAKEHQSGDQPARFLFLGEPPEQGVNRNDDKGEDGGDYEKGIIKKIIILKRLSFCHY